jgi:hypothetical protein
MGNQAKSCEATGTFWVMRCYVQSLAIYPVAAHRSSDYEPPGARVAAVQTPPTVAPASRKLASGFIAGLRGGEAGRIRGDVGSGGDKADGEAFGVVQSVTR